MPGAVQAPELGNVYRSDRGSSVRWRASWLLLMPPSGATVAWAATLPRERNVSSLP